VRPPKNQILENLYTPGNEWMLSKTYDNYVGYYHSVSGKKFIGATYKPNAIQLISFSPQRAKVAYSISQVDSAYLNINPKILNVIKNDSFDINRVKYIPTSIPVFRFFIKRKNEINTPIIEVSKNTYLNARKTNFYYSLTLLWDLNKISLLDYSKLEQNIPGIKDFLNNLSSPPSGDSAN
jgi:hypothetical protein